MGTLGAAEVQVASLSNVFAADEVTRPETREPLGTQRLGSTDPLPPHLQACARALCPLQSLGERKEKAVLQKQPPQMAPFLCTKTKVTKHEFKNVSAVISTLHRAIYMSRQAPGT